ncbi:MAG: BlaI/MecI/CopY family transcriptional regulator [Butyricicoccus sp.]|nr:BlaI/MecI/CopY family transcriptional regulator [Butyricicoccus sp.]MCM1232980.1 BlaI/MecI/CopY family transcriptional regulator [Ruminococcus flavefaciens]
MVLTKSELEIMNVMWRVAAPMTRNDIIAQSTDKTWKDSSIHILLNSLLKKEAIKEVGFTRCGKNYARLFGVNISCEDYYAETVFPAGGKENLPMLFSALIRSEHLTTELIDELEDMLKKKKAELDGSGN